MMTCVRMSSAGATLSKEVIVTVSTEEGSGKHTLEKYKIAPPTQQPLYEGHCRSKNIII